VYFDWGTGGRAEVGGSAVGRERMGRDISVQQVPSINLVAAEFSGIHQQKQLLDFHALTELAQSSGIVNYARRLMLSIAPSSRNSGLKLGRQGKWVVGG